MIFLFVACKQKKGESEDSPELAREYYNFSVLLVSVCSVSIKQRFNRSSKQSCRWSTKLARFTMLICFDQEVSRSEHSIGSNKIKKIYRVDNFIILMLETNQVFDFVEMVID